MDPWRAWDGRTGDGDRSAAITDATLAAALVLGLFQLALPRRYSFVPVLAAGCYMTLGQALVVGGLHFHLLRLLILFGLARILLRKELSGITPHAIDAVLMAWLLVSSFLYVLFDGSNVALTTRLGYAYNAVGIYILVRASVRSLEDIAAVLTACAVFIIPLAVLFVVESATGRNPFAVFGGVAPLSEIRNGRVRCQGPFLHSILAGTFGATAIPPLVGLCVYSNRRRVLAALAVLGATTIVITSGSSGPLLAFGVSSAALACWFSRRFTREIRWGLVAGLVALALVMKRPVWFLIDKVSESTGGSGWYRSALIDAAVRHFGEWWLIGTGYTAHWMPTGVIANPNSADLVNEFVAQGVYGGLLALLLFIWLIAKSFGAVGQAVRAADQGPSATSFLLWSLGCGLVGHVASFFSVSYFDQITIFWYLQIGVIVALAPTAQAAVSSGSAASARNVPAGNPKLAPLPATSLRRVNAGLSPKRAVLSPRGSER